LVGHTFEHHIAAPDDPVLLRYEMRKLWPEKKKLWSMEREMGDQRLNRNNRLIEWFNR
jgi:hypothetical protein